MKIDQSDIKNLQLELLDVVMQMMKKKPDSIPLVAVYYNDRVKGLEVIPIGNVTDKEIQMFAKAILHPDKPMAERVVFTNDPPKN